MGTKNSTTQKLKKFGKFVKQKQMDYLELNQENKSGPSVLFLIRNGNKLHFKKSTH